MGYYITAGQRFGRWTALEDADRTMRNRIQELTSLRQVEK